MAQIELRAPAVQLQVGGLPSFSSPAGQPGFIDFLQAEDDK